MKQFAPHLHIFIRESVNKCCHFRFPNCISNHTGMVINPICLGNQRHCVDQSGSDHWPILVIRVSTPLLHYYGHFRLTRLMTTLVKESLSVSDHQLFLDPSLTRHAKFGRHKTDGLLHAFVSKNRRRIILQKS